MVILKGGNFGSRRHTEWSQIKWWECQRLKILPGLSGLFFVFARGGGVSALPRAEATLGLHRFRKNRQRNTASRVTMNAQSFYRAESRSLLVHKVCLGRAAVLG